MTRRRKKPTTTIAKRFKTIFADVTDEDYDTDPLWMILKWINENDPNARGGFANKDKKDIAFYFTDGSMVRCSKPEWQVMQWRDKTPFSSYPFFNPDN